jgi:quercetin dioxygenase-like cupin family protein
MKKLSLVAAAGGALVAFSAYAAPDVCSVGPEHCKILKEDAKVRVIDFTAKAGDKLPLHSHPAHVVYIIKAGKTQFTLEDGTKPKPTDSKDGDALINPAVTHSQEHLEDVHVIVVEFKQ